MTRLLFTGDTGTGGEAQQRVAELLARLSVRFAPQAIVLCGDNFMDFGVRGIDDPQWDSKFERMYAAPALSGMPFYAILGNHDYKGDVRAQLAYSDRAGRWRMPARHYAVSFGADVDLVCFDTNWPDYSGIGLLSMDRVARRARRLGGRWKVAVGHRPLLTGGKYERVPWNVRWFLRGMLRDCGATVYVSGHDHNLQHLVDGATGVHQIVCGGGGSPLQPVRERVGETRFARSSHGAVLGEFSTSEAKFSFFGLEDEEPLHTFRLGSAGTEP